MNNKITFALALSITLASFGAATYAATDEAVQSLNEVSGEYSASSISWWWE